MGLNIRTDDITSNPVNIAFLSNTCKNVSSKIRDMENRTNEYECGELLICREYTTFDNHVFNVNFRYDIVVILDGALLLKNVKDEKPHPLPLDKARSFFIFGSCCTAHSAQRCSVDSEITIFEYNHFLVKNYPEWLWTALTRCRDLSKVNFSKYSRDWIRNYSSYKRERPHGKNISRYKTDTIKWHTRWKFRAEFRRNVSRPKNTNWNGGTAHDWIDWFSFWNENSVFEE